MKRIRVYRYRGKNTRMWLKVNGIKSVRLQKKLDFLCTYDIVQAVLQEKRMQFVPIGIFIASFVLLNVFIRAKYGLTEPNRQAIVLAAAAFLTLFWSGVAWLVAAVFTTPT
jgi:hypothetical protein